MKLKMSLWIFHMDLNVEEIGAFPLTELKNHKWDERANEAIHLVFQSGNKLKLTWI